jgi:hypothetical protein
MLVMKSGLPPVRSSSNGAISRRRTTPHAIKKFLLGDKFLRPLGQEV